MIQDKGYRIQDTGYMIHDTGYRIQDKNTGYRIQVQNTGYRIQDTGYRIRCKQLHICSKHLLYYNFSKRIYPGPSAIKLQQY